MNRAQTFGPKHADGAVGHILHDASRQEGKDRNES